MSFFENSDGIDCTVLFLEEAIERQSSESQSRKRNKMLETQHYMEIERMSRRSSRELQLVASSHRGQIGNLINLAAIQRAYIEKLEAKLDQSNYLRRELEKQNEENENRLNLTQKKLEVVEDLIEHREEQNENLNRRVDLEAKRLETIIEQQMEQICELKASESLLNDEV